MVVKPAWGKDQPNNYNGEQNCVVLDGGRNWLWNDVGCNLDYLHWICQHCKYIHIYLFNIYPWESSKDVRKVYLQLRFIIFLTAAMFFL